MSARCIHCTHLACSEVIICIDRAISLSIRTCFHFISIFLPSQCAVLSCSLPLLVFHILSFASLRIPSPPPLLRMLPSPYFLLYRYCVFLFISSSLIFVQTEHSAVHKNWLFASFSRNRISSNIISILNAHVHDLDHKHLSILSLHHAIDLMHLCSYFVLLSLKLISQLDIPHITIYNWFNLIMFGKWLKSKSKSRYSQIEPFIQFKRQM